MSEFELSTRLLASLGVGLLLGLERERHPAAKAGIRTFALAALLGTLAALLSQKSANAWLMPVIGAALAIMMVSAYRQVRSDEDPGTTSTVALLICYVLGGVIWHGEQQLAVMVALAVTGLLYFKAELDGVTRHLSRQDWISLFQFAVVTFVVLPVLPDTGLGPLGALNPYRVWLMVVLVSGLSIAGYVVLRLVGDRRALPLVGMLGGLVSSTATTLSYSRLARDTRGAAGTMQVVVLAANAVVLAKLAAVTALVSPRMLPHLLPVLGCGLLAAVPAPLLKWRRLGNRPELPELKVSNPSEMRVALGFAALYACILLAVAWLHQAAGTAGVYAMAILSGLTDIDAISLSTLQLANSGDLAPQEAARAIALAYLASVVLKFGVTWATAGPGFARGAAVGYACTAAGIVTGLLVSAWAA
jgi:uncharacterized membrane protein (DUF4010 family)